MAPKLRERAIGLFNDLCAGAGVLAVLHGLNLIYPPIALITAGVGMIMLSWTLARR